MLNKDSLYFVYLRATRMHYLRTQRLLSEIGVYQGQPPLLFLLAKNDGLSQKEIADKLQTTPSTIAVMLKRMEKAKILTRRQDEKDQRISRVYLTKKGRNVSIEAKEAIRTLAEESFGGLSPEEKEEFKRLLKKMSNNLEGKLN